LREEIVVIDASLEAQHLVAEAVQATGSHQVVRAQSGVDGLRLVRERDPALVILDHKLPDRDSFGLLREFQQLVADVPVIFVSADSSPGTILRAFRLGATDFLAKPFAAEEVLAAIRRTLRAHRRPSGHKDLTRQLREANRQLQAQFQELNTVYVIGRAVTSLLDLNQVLNRVVEAAVHTVGAEEGMIMLLGDETDELYLRAAMNVGEETAHNLRLRVDSSAAGRALQTNRPVHLTGDALELGADHVVKSVLYVPLRVPERGAIGVLGIGSRSASKTFSRRDVNLMSALGDYAAIAIENARLFRHAETERAKLEAVLREAEEAILVVDRNNQILLCNAAASAIWHLRDTDLSQRQAARSVEELIPESSIRDMFAARPEEGGTIHRDVTLGNKRTYNAHLTPVEDVGRVLMLQDITHLKELDRLKSEFVATVSHDLRTPLTSIQGYVELLPYAGPLNEKQAQYIARVQASLKSITDLINDLLEMRRLESVPDLEMEPCDLREIVDHVMERLDQLARTKGQDLRWEKPEALPLVMGNPRSLVQVMDNLVNNAIKYTQEGGWISITATEDEGHVVVNVSDNGFGIPPEEQPRIFERFYRVKSEQARNITGTGLGLAIVKAVVDKHKGRVWVESKPGAGSTFSFVLAAIGEES
jgi:two-component system NtrC family sensor kinase